MQGAATGLRIWSVAAASLTLLIVAAMCSRPAVRAQTQAPLASPPPPPVAILPSCNEGVPRDAETHLPKSFYEQRPYFDDYSWHAFAALICAGRTDVRGVAVPAEGRDGEGPRVFETFKPAWELFHAGTEVRDWDEYEDKQYNPCGEQAANGDLVLASTSKFQDTLQFGAGTPTIPLQAQNWTYVHYLTQYNKVSFDYMRGVILSQSSQPSQFPVGSINVKSAWVEMKELNESRFYVRKAWIPTAPHHCEQVKVGLVGLHIVQKTWARPGWIWTTFEQIDNAPDEGASQQQLKGPYTFNRGGPQKMPTEAPTCNKADGPPRCIFNVERSWHGIKDITQKRDLDYQQLFGPKSVWSYYELVMTQWPVIPDPQVVAHPVARRMVDQRTSHWFGSGDRPVCPLRRKGGACRTEKPVPSARAMGA